MPEPADVVGEFTDARLVALYDSWRPARPDHAFYRDLAATMPAQTIVDIGCGTGNLAIELARRGHQMTGVDPSPAMLAMARRRDGAELVRWIEGDATVIEEGGYDLVVMAGNVVPVVTDNREFVATLAAIRRALRPGGRLAFDSLNPVTRPWTRWTPSQTRRVLADGIEAWFQDCRSDGDLVTFQTHYRFSTGGHLVAHGQRRFRSYGWLRRALIDAGFHVYPVDHDAANLIFLASASTRHPVALHIRPGTHGDLVATVLYDTGEDVTVPIGGLGLTVVLQRLLDLDVPTDLALRELEQYGFDVHDDVRQRSETDMAAWRAADQIRRMELKRKFWQRRDRSQHRPPDEDPHPPHS